MDIFFSNHGIERKMQIFQNFENWFQIEIDLSRLSLDMGPLEKSLVCLPSNFGKFD